MPIVCGVRFRGTCKVYYFSSGDTRDVKVDDYVIVETARGREMGRVVMSARNVNEAEIVGQLKPLLRRATLTDLLDAQHLRAQEADAVARCKEQVAKFSLPMKIVGAEYSFDGSRLTFFFASEQRVDFRELVRELARIYKTRIELRQIGVRDQARIVGGIGKCGRLLCCATWLTEFSPVSIRMAKQQDLPLSPMEISGLCGRLLCCLGYENKYYGEIKAKFPKVGKTVETPYGVGKVKRICVLRETVTILMEDGSIRELTAEQLGGEALVKAEDQRPSLSEAQQRALSRVVSARAPELASSSHPEVGKEPSESAALPGEARPRTRSRPRFGRRRSTAPTAEASPKKTSESAGGGDGRGRALRRSQRQRPHHGRLDGSPVPRGETQPSTSQEALREEKRKRRRRPRKRRGGRIERTDRGQNVGGNRVKDQVRNG